MRKEFEKWAVLTYTNNRAIINEKKGADAGIDGIAYTAISATDSAKIVLQVKSGHVSRRDIATLHSDMLREGAPMAIFITLEPPTKPMIDEAKAIPQYYHPLMGKNYDAIQIVTIQDILEHHARLNIPMSREVLRSAQRKATAMQAELMSDTDAPGDEDEVNDDEDADDE